MAPHLDKGELVTRAVAAELALKARIDADRKTNGDSIREQIEDGSAGVGGKPKSVHCGICGSPFGDRTQDRNACADCRREAKQVPPGTRDKLGPEELYPEHFSESTHEHEEVE